jgi:glucose-6-phosphate 1-epimerase
MGIEELERLAASVAGVSVAAGKGGLQAVKVSRDGLSGEVYLHGGQVTRWKPSGAEEVLFTSEQSSWAEGKAIRGGVPICFPWFGPKQGDGTAPQHGFARTRAWKLEQISEEGGGVVIELSDASDDLTRRLWPFDYSIRNRVTLGSTLKMELEVKNTGSVAFTFEEAQHSYFSVGNVQECVVEGLDDYQYSDKTQGGARVRQRGDVTFRGEVDRPYFDTRENIVIVDASKKRKVTIAKTNSDATVIWNPWMEKAKAMKDLGDEEWQRFVCVESCNLGSSAVTLQPGESHRMTTEISITSM